MIKKLKTQNSKLKTSTQNFPATAGFRQRQKKFLVLSFSFALCALNFTFNSYATEITILYTGETHAMIYPCNCPKDSDGGVARRATLIKQLREDNPDTLILDSGGFFAGGLMDEYTQNTELDMQRSSVNLKAIELMRYDALTIGDDEFNFGRDFLKQMTDKPTLNFLSCNIFYERASPTNLFSSALFKPYIIKEVGGLKIGIIGVTSLSAAQKAGELKFIEPKTAVRQIVAELKNNKVNIIVLLSHLGESEDLKLINGVEGIDILITGHSRSKEEPYSKIDNILVLRSSWQGRRLGKLSLTIKDKKITDFKVEELRLSDKINDDPDILSILPHCFSDNNCKKEGMIGMCHDHGTLKSQCLFTEAAKIPLLIITPKYCSVCNTENVVKYLKTLFPGLVISYLYYPDIQATELTRDFDIKVLPVYLLSKEVEKEKGFDNFRENLETKGNFYILKPQFSGISYLLNRNKIKGRLDLFISLYHKDTPALLDMMNEFNPTVHFLAVEQGKDKFEAEKGKLEVEEYIRSLCVQKYYPAHFWNYISCRAKNINSSWWEDCLIKLDTNKIRMCARRQDGKNLLKENISLSKELQIMLGPTFLLDNQEVFGLQGVPSKEEFKKIIKR